MKNYMMTFANRESAMQAVKVALVGVANTLVYLVLFNIFLALGFAWFWAVTTAFVLTTFMSYVLNRRWTFELTDGKVSGRETASFFGVNTVAYLASVAIIWLADTLFGPLSTIGYNLAAIFAAGLLILPKLAGYRDIVFSKALGRQSEPAPVTAE
jgi:putative flippase GtrA